MYRCSAGPAFTYPFVILTEQLYSLVILTSEASIHI